MSKTCILVHLVFATKGRARSIDLAKKEQLYRYMYGIFRQNKCFVLKINGTDDHIHCLFDLHPQVSLSTLVKVIKAGTHYWLDKERLFPNFVEWGCGYYAGSISPAHKDACIEYINNQEQHHLHKPFLDEVSFMAERYGMTYHPNDWS